MHALLVSLLLLAAPVAKIDGPVQVKQGELVTLSYALSEGDGFEFSYPDTIRETQLIHDINDQRLIFATNRVGSHKFELLAASCGEDKKIIFARTEHVIEVLPDPTNPNPPPSPPGPGPDPPQGDGFTPAIQRAYAAVIDDDKSKTTLMLAAVYNGLITTINNGTIKTVDQAIQARQLGVATALRLANKSQEWADFDIATVAALDKLNPQTIAQVSDAFARIAGVLK